MEAAMQLLWKDDAYFYCLICTHTGVSTGRGVSRKLLMIFNLRGPLALPSFGDDCAWRPGTTAQCLLCVFLETACIISAFSNLHTIVTEWDRDILFGGNSI
jgi:hypothetical protein